MKNSDQANDMTNDMNEKLKYLGVNFDPYLPSADQKCLEIIRELNLSHLIDDPIQLSNHILVKLLEAEEQERMEKYH